MEGNYTAERQRHPYSWCKEAHPPTRQKRYPLVYQVFNNNREKYYVPCSRETYQKAVNIAKQKYRDKIEYVPGKLWMTYVREAIESFHPCQACMREIPEGDVWEGHDYRFCKLCWMNAVEMVARPPAEDEQDADELPASDPYNDDLRAYLGANHNERRSHEDIF